MVSGRSSVDKIPVNMKKAKISKLRRDDSAMTHEWMKDGRTYA